MNAKLMLQAYAQRPIAYYSTYRDVTGSVTSAVLFSQIMHWWGVMGGSEFYKSDQDLMDETKLSKKEMENAKKRIKALSFVTVGKRRVGRDTFTTYDVDADGLSLAISAVTQAEMDKKEAKIKKRQEDLLRAKEQGDFGSYPVPTPPESKGVFWDNCPSPKGGATTPRKRERVLPESGDPYIHKNTNKDILGKFDENAQDNPKTGEDSLLEITQQRREKEEKEKREKQEAFFKDFKKLILNDTFFVACAMKNYKLKNMAHFVALLDTFISDKKALEEEHRVYSTLKNRFYYSIRIMKDRRSIQEQAIETNLFDTHMDADEEKKYKSYLKWREKTCPRIPVYQVLTASQYSDIRNDKTLSARKNIMTNATYAKLFTQAHLEFNSKMWLRNDYKSVFDYILDLVRKKAN